jgi:hypothetical protein
MGEYLIKILDQMVLLILSSWKTVDLSYRDKIKSFETWETFLGNEEKAFIWGKKAKFMFVDNRIVHLTELKLGSCLEGDIQYSVFLEIRKLRYILDRYTLVCTKIRFREVASHRTIRCPEPTSYIGRSSIRIVSITRPFFNTSWDSTRTNDTVTRITR